MSPAEHRQDLVRSVALLALWTLAALWLRDGIWAPDLGSLYMAGWFWSRGEEALIYAAPPGFFGGVAESWLPALHELGIADGNTFPYVYPPLWAAIVAPVTQALTPQAFVACAALIQIPMLAASVLLAGRLARPADWRWTTWTFWGLAVLSTNVATYHALWHNQPGITVIFLSLLAIERLEAGKPGLAGALLAVAAALKLTPAVLILVFVLDRQPRALAGFALAGLALALLSLAIAGLPLHLDFIRALGAISEQTLLSQANASIEAAAQILAGWPHSLTLPWPVAVPTPAWLGPLVTSLALLLGLAMLLRMTRLRGRERRAAATLGLWVIAILFGPLGWLHSYVMALLLLPVLRLVLPSGLALALMLLPMIVLAMPLYVFAPDLGWVPQPGLVIAACAVWLPVPVALALAARSRV